MKMHYEKLHVKFKITLEKYNNMIYYNFNYVFRNLKFQVKTDKNMF